MAINNSLSVSAGYVNFQVQGYAAFTKVSVEQADAAKNLLGQFKFETGFASIQVSGQISAQQASASLGAGAGVYGDLLAAPKDYDKASIGASIEALTGNMGLSSLLDVVDEHTETFMKAFDRMATSMLRDVVAQAGVTLKELSALAQPKQVTGTDTFATHKYCREGRHNPSNMNDSDHIKLAVYNILKRDGNPGAYNALPAEDLAKKLEAEYGIKAEVTKVASKEGDQLTSLKFENGAVFADGAGDGAMDLRDYDFKGAVDDITKRTGMTPEKFAAGAVDFKADQVAQADFRKQLQNFEKEAKALYEKLGTDFQAKHGYALADSPLGAQLNWTSTPEAPKPKPGERAERAGRRHHDRNFFPMVKLNMLFAQAFAFAGLTPAEERRTEEARRPARNDRLQ